MSLNLIGRYKATLGKSVLSETQGGALMFYVEVNVDRAEGGTYPPLRGAICLVKKDGEMRQKAIDNLKKVLHGLWDGTFEQLETIDPTGIRVTVVCKDSQERDGKVYTEIDAIWPEHGGGLGLPAPTPAGSLASKYASKFAGVAAASGTATTAPKAQAPATAAPMPSAPPSAPPKPTVDLKAIANAAWDVFDIKAMPDASSESKAKKWFELMRKHANTEEQSKVNAEQWAAIRAEIDGMAAAAGADDSTPF